MIKEEYRFTWNPWVHVLKYFSIKYLPSRKRKKWSLCLKKRFEKQQMYRTFQQDSALSNISKWNLFQTYMPWFLTLIGCKYLNFIFLDAFSDSLLILSSSKKFVSIFHDIIHGSNISWPIPQKKWWAILSQWTPISEISSKCLHNLLLSQETIHQNNESPVLPLIWTHLRSTNAWLKYLNNKRINFNLKNTLIPLRK